jgi:hypothetical protein
MDWILVLYIYVDWVNGTKVQQVEYKTEQQCLKARKEYAGDANIKAYCIKKEFKEQAE